MTNRIHDQQASQVSNLLAGGIIVESGNNHDIVSCFSIEKGLITTKALVLFLKKENKFLTTKNNLAIQTHGLSKSFGEVQALRDLDLAVPKNSITGFLGPNGAGKTTAIRLLLGLNQPTAGSGKIFGLDIHHDSEEIRRRTGYLAQEPRFYDDMTAREILRFAARFFFSGPPKGIEDRIDEMLEMVGLVAKADRPIKGFSGGEKQRLGIAQAQINAPELLILDEPAASLDPMGRRDVLQIMERLRGQATVFYSTHILGDVQRVSDQVVILNQGYLVTQGPIELLLGGSDGIVFSLEIQGSTHQAREIITRQPWVTSLDSQVMNGNTLFRVAVNDEEAAEAQLLRLVLADQDLTVLRFGKEKLELEEVFLQLVEGV